MSRCTSLLFGQISDIDEVESVTDAWVEFHQKREDIPVVNFKEHHDLIQFCIDPTKGSIDEYMDHWEYIYTSRNLIPPSTRQELLDHRLKFIRRAIRKGPWKLIFSDKSGGFSDNLYKDGFGINTKGQLYTLSNDIGEKQNLYGTYPQILDSLKKIFNLIAEQN